MRNGEEEERRLREQYETLDVEWSEEKRTRRRRGAEEQEEEMKNECEIREDGKKVKTERCRRGEERLWVSDEEERRKDGVQAPASHSAAQNNHSAPSMRLSVRKIKRERERENFFCQAKNIVHTSRNVNTQRLFNESKQTVINFLSFLTGQQSKN